MIPDKETTTSNNYKIITISDYYYKKTEIDTMMNGKANTSHTHTASEITDFPVIPDVNNYIQKSSTSGLVKNDGSIDTTSYLSSLPSHTHTKSEIKDFTHTHMISEVTNLQTNLNAKVNTSDIANNLTTTASGKVLDARQGKALKDYVDGLVGNIENDMLL